jgi:hypothetical protein
MAGDTNNRQQQENGWFSDGSALTRSPRLADLLKSADTDPRLLSWSAAQAIVESAPPVQASWLRQWSAGSVRGLRYGLSSLLALGFGTGLLAMLPAHSDNVGTMIVTDLPSAWTAGSVQMEQFQAGARERFAALDLPQSELYVLDVAQSGERPELALALLNVDEPAARHYFDALADKYPAIEAYPAEYGAIDTELAGNRLNELFLQMTNPGALNGADENEIHGRVLGTLGRLGLTPLSVETERLADGTLVVEIDAEMSIAVEGASPAALESHNLSPDTLGDAAYQRLLTELGTR